MREGWTWLWNARKWHYFRSGKSLCGRWGILSENALEVGKDDSEDNCTGCRRKLIGEQPVGRPH